MITENDMKQTELRIGNIVKIDDEYLGPIEGKVTSLNDKGEVELLLSVNKGHIRYFVCGSDDIFPIPITEEWLTKIGFILPEHKEFYVMCRINGKDNSIRLTRYFNLWNAEIFASHPEVVMLEHTIKGLRFVHELQNAYQLVTGKELEIKL